MPPATGNLRGDPLADDILPLPRRRIGDTAALAIAALFILAIGVWIAFGSESEIYVNGARLSPEAVQTLQRSQPAAAQPGRYWYDPVSGAWGREGGPMAGQLQPWMRLGGMLQADASRGHSGVFINGRQLTAGEKEYLEHACGTPVSPGQYWVNAQGVGGYEGMGAAFNLAECGQGAPARGSSTRTTCDGQGNCSSTGLWGSVITGH